MLLVFLTLPSLLAVVPPGDAQGTVCIGQIQTVDALPSIWVNRGDTVNVKIFVSGSNGAVPTLQGYLPVEVDVAYAGGSPVSIGPPVNFVPPQTRQDIQFTVPGDAGEGFATITVKEQAPPANDNCVWADGTGAGSVSWGVWVDKKPDLYVPAQSPFSGCTAPCGGVYLVRHDDTSSVLDDHENMTAGENLTRYPDVAGVCTEERTGPNTPAGPQPYYGQAHFGIVIGNRGTADFATPEPQGQDLTGDHHALNVTVDVLVDGQLLARERVPLSGPLAPGAFGNVTFPAVWGLARNAGPHNVTVALDPLRTIPQTDGTNDVSSRVVRVEGPRLHVDVRAMGLYADDRVRGTVTITNTGTTRAGSVDALTAPDSLLCMSTTGGNFVSRAYVDQVDAQHLLRFNGVGGDPNNISATLDPVDPLTGQCPAASVCSVSATLQDAGPVLAPGAHTVIIMANDHVDGTPATPLFLSEYGGSSPFLDATCCNVPKHHGR
jgi:hypothetical protein